jgi:uncharacterized Zn finger protein (UPF0148 family)
MRVAQNISETRQPEPVDTLRALNPCPVCENPNMENGVCGICGYGDYPETTSPPDTEKVKEKSDIPTEKVKPEQVAKPESKPKGESKDSKPKVEDKTKDEKAKSKESAMRRVSQSQPDGDAPAECPFCGYDRFMWEPGFGDGNWICVDCGKDPSSKSAMQRVAGGGTFSKNWKEIPSGWRNSDESLADKKDGYFTLTVYSCSDGGGIEIQEFGPAQYDEGNPRPYNDYLGTKRYEINKNNFKAVMDAIGASGQIRQGASMNIHTAAKCFECGSTKITTKDGRSKCDKCGKSWAHKTSAADDGDYDPNAKTVTMPDGTVHKVKGTRHVTDRKVNPFTESVLELEGGNIGISANPRGTKIKVVKDGSTAHPGVAMNANSSPRGGSIMPRAITAAEAARIRFNRRKAQVDTGVADLTTDVTVLDGTSSVPLPAEGDAVLAPTQSDSGTGESTVTTVETPGIEIAPAAPASTEVTAPTAVPVADVSEVLLPVAVDPGTVTEPFNPPVFPAEIAPEVTPFGGDAAGTVEPNPSVTAARAALIGGMSLVESRIKAGLEQSNIDKVALADKFARTLSVREMRIASVVIEEMLTKSAQIQATRGMVPRRAERTAASLPQGAGSSVPNEAIFGL